jgi:hypothetical protein
MRFFIRLGPNERIELNYTPGGGGTARPSASSSTTLTPSRRPPEALARYNAAVDGMEHLIPAQACAGIDVTGEDYLNAVITAFNAINDQFG